MAASEILVFGQLPEEGLILIAQTSSGDAKNNRVSFFSTLRLVIS